MKAVREPSRRLALRKLPALPTWRSSSWTVVLALQLFTTAALVVDAYVHVVNAGLYDPAVGGLITEGNLFRAEAAVATLVAVVVLLRPTILSWAAALMVAASALAAVIVYRYVNVGPLGPIPNLYEPTWAPSGKLLSAYAEASAVILAASGLLVTRLRPRTRRKVNDGRLPPCTHRG